MGPAGGPASSDDLICALRGLGLAATVLHIGVHPDDEDVGMVAYLARGVGARVVYWSATRGEGGQNRISHERAEALGVLRTWESLAARAVDGGEVAYGPFYDFGFSKSAEDTFARWPREQVTREVARAIRLIQPLVVVSRWSGTAFDGHGQHQAIGQVIEDAWRLAADPGALPELDLPAWEARKLYRSLGGDWQPGEDAQPGARMPEHEHAGHLRIDTGAVDPISGRSFQELGHLALNQHRTQGMAFPPERGSYYYYYRLQFTHGDPVAREQGFFEGVEMRLRGLARYPGGSAPQLEEHLKAADAAIDAAIDAYRPQRPAEAGVALLEAIAALERVRAPLSEAGSVGASPNGAGADAALARYLGHKIDGVANVAGRCLGLRLECVLDPQQTTPGGRVRARARVWSDGSVPNAEVGVPRLELPDRWTATPVASRAATQAEAAAPGAVESHPDVAEVGPSPAADGPTAAAHGRAADDQPPHGPAAAADYDVTVGDRRWAASPYWLLEPRGPYRYVWPRAASLAQPFDEPLVHANAEVRIGERELRLRVAGHHPRAVPGGAGELRLTVLPAFALEPRHTRLLLPVPSAEVTLEVPVLVRCLRAEGQAATIALACPAGWRAQPPAAEVSLERGGEERTVAFQITVPAGARPGRHDLRYLVAGDGAPYGVSLEPVRLGLGPTPPTASTAVAEAFVTRPSTLQVTLVDVAFVAGHRYAYVPGLDDEIVASLGAFDLDVTRVRGDELAFAELDGYDAIVVGPNAYNARPAVRANAQRLLDYVAGGGTLIVQYQTYGFDEPGLAPFTFEYHQPHDRVTLTSAPITAVAPDHPVLHVPNELSEADWDGWVHDRGMYFFGTWDERYAPVLACNDPGEEPRLGGLLVAAHGRGTFAYCGYSLHRQIPAGVPGGLRLLANLLGLAEARIADRARRLRPAAVLGFLSDEELERAARSVGERWVAQGEELVRAGDTEGAIHVGVDVELEVVRDGTTRVAAVGEPVGGFAVLLDGPFPDTHRARGAGRVLELRAEVLRDWLRREPALTERLVAALAGELVRRDA